MGHSLVRFEKLDEGDGVHKRSLSRSRLIAPCASPLVVGRKHLLSSRLLSSLVEMDLVLKMIL